MRQSFALMLQVRAVREPFGDRTVSVGSVSALLKRLFIAAPAAEPPSVRGHPGCDEIASLASWAATPDGNNQRAAAGGRGCTLCALQVPSRPAAGGDSLWSVMMVSATAGAYTISIEPTTGVLGHFEAILPKIAETLALSRAWRVLPVQQGGTLPSYGIARWHL